MPSVRFGMEYELERTSSRYRPEGWRAESDGTLRESGYEFLFRNPSSLTRSKELVNRLLSSIGSNYSVSHRCSTRIHVDTQSLKGYQRVALLLGLLIHDEWFFQYGPGRENNSFCCPVLRSPAAVCSINAAVRAYDWRDGEPVGPPAVRRVNRLSEQDTKYMSVNTMPLNSLGTIELRHFAPLMNVEDVDTVLTKISDLFDTASAICNTSKREAGEIWTGFDSDLASEITWVQGAYALHNNMVGN